MSAPTCPICKRPTEASTRPFCSPRCRDVDLSRWFSGAYAIPVLEEDEERSSAGPDPGPHAGQGREPPL